MLVNFPDSDINYIIVHIVFHMLPNNHFCHLEELALGTTRRTSRISALLVIM
jgi:hypothetical protein